MKKTVFSKVKLIVEFLLVCTLLTIIKTCLKHEAIQMEWFQQKEVIWFFLEIGLICGMIGVGLEVLITKLRDIWMESRRDKLTGLLNKKTAEKEINKMLNAKDFDKGAFFMIDIDKFNIVNIRFGEKGGDEAIVQFANMLRSLFRASDIISRIDAERFIVFIPYQGDGAFLEKKYESLLHMAHMDIGIGVRLVKITASVGVVYAPAQGTNYLDLAIKAEMALRRSKELGPDRLTVYEDMFEHILEEAKKEAEEQQ